MRFALVDDKEELRDHVAMLLGEFAAEQRLHYKLDCFASGEDFLNYLALAKDPTSDREEDQ